MKDIEGDKPPLPDAVLGMVMYGGRQAEGSEQCAGPREIALRAQRFQDRKRTGLFCFMSLTIAEVDSAASGCSNS